MEIRGQGADHIRWDIGQGESGDVVQTSGRV